MNTNRLWMAGPVLMAAALLMGCTTQPRRVSCDEHLQPINATSATTAVLQSGEGSQRKATTGQVPP